MKREREMEWGEEWQQEDGRWVFGVLDPLWPLSGKSLAGITQRDKRKQLKEPEICQRCRSTVGSR